jgi:hypothetical protein
VSTETRLRDALRDAADRVVVDDELAWQRAWLEVAQHPVRRVRRVSLTLAVASVVVIGVLAWQLLDRASPPGAVHSPVPTGQATGTVPPTLFDELTPGHLVDPAAWVTAADALAAARDDVAGTLTVTYAGDLKGTAASSGPVRPFAVDTSGEWRYGSGPTFTTYWSDGALVSVNTATPSVQVQAEPASTSPRPAATPAQIVVTERDLDHLLRPGAWLESVMTAEHPVITFLGATTAGGRPVDRFGFAFPGSTTYGDGGWQLDLDARTGIVRRVVVDYLPSSGIDRQTLTVDGLADGGAPLANGAVVVPDGAVVGATVGTTGVTGFRAAPGTTIAALLAQIRSLVP